MIRRVGILTAGGDCPGINAVIRAVAKAAINDYEIEIIGIHDGYLGLIENRTMELHYSDVSDILTRGGTILGTSNRSDPFRFAVEKKGKMVLEDRSHDVVHHFKALQLDALVVIGGDGSLAIAHKLLKKGLPIVGVPKTIDNDLDETDFTFGFPTAVETATEAIDKIHTTAQSHHRVMVIEVMGRYAGWLTLYSGVAGGGDIILIPEIPFSWERLTQKVKERGKKGKRFTIVVVAEGAKPKGGKQVVQRLVQGSPEPVRLGGIGQVVAAELEKRTGHEARTTVLGHLLRGGSPSGFDRLLATQFGKHALELVVQGKFGRMACLKQGAITSCPIEKAIRRLKLVGRNHPLVQSARSLGVSFGV